MDGKGAVGGTHAWPMALGDVARFLRRPFEGRYSWEGEPDEATSGGFSMGLRAVRVFCGIYARVFVAVAGGCSEYAGQDAALKVTL